MSESYNKTVVSTYYASEGLPEPVFEFVFHPERKFRFDLAWPDYKVALEVQGGLFANKAGKVGRHARGAALMQEHVKLNLAASLGWLVLFCIPRDVATMGMVKLICETLSRRDREQRRW